MQRMAGMTSQTEFCKICNKTFSDWDALKLHKIQSKDHICCLFCGQDFKTIAGCSRHQFQNHAAEQNLQCAGCKMQFVRVGSYISHIEQEQCPVIHQSQFAARQIQRGKKYEATRLENPVPDTATAPSHVAPNLKAVILNEIRIAGDGPLEFDDTPKQTSWERWGCHDSDTFDALKDFPPLPLQDFKDGGAKIPDLLSGRPDKLDQKNLAWIVDRELFPNLPKPVTPPRKNMASMVIGQPTREDDFHPFDPDNPVFDIEKYYNPITRKYRCAWPGCKKLQDHREGLRQHLRSQAHRDLKLRCPQCLRQFSSATALVQHAESQAVKCQIRDSGEYRQAVDLLTAGFVETAGRHVDDTVRYVAPLAAFAPGNIIPSKDTIQSQMTAATNAWLAKQEETREMMKQRMEESSQDW